jgi:tetratricopeptide (TPR) repeat protein
MVGRPSPQNQSICRLTLLPETILSCSRRMRQTEFQPHSGRHRAYNRALPILLEISEFSFPSHTKQNVLLNLALCYQSSREFELALATAARVIAIDRHSNSGLQARGIVIELNTDDPRRQQRLEAIEKLCRRENADVAANNIALLRAREAADNANKVREILTPVVKGTRDSKDYYNRIRAVIELTNLSLEAGQRLSDADMSHLIGSYHFLFNERIPALFDKCHDTLWKGFDRTGDRDNLLRLFRHSSLYWRLRGREDKESPYLASLANRIGSDLSEKVASMKREVAYYIVRAGAAKIVEHIEDED